jgi:hypothetical protein
MNIKLEKKQDLKQQHHKVCLTHPSLPPPPFFLTLKNKSKEKHHWHYFSICQYMNTSMQKERIPRLQVTLEESN